jgi:hypothetical protein
MPLQSSFKKPQAVVASWRTPRQSRSWTGSGDSRDLFASVRVVEQDIASGK